jgi:stress-induced morphogen
MGACKERANAAEVNISFTERLQDLTFKQEAQNLYSQIVKQVFENNSDEKKKDRTKILEEISTNKTRLSKEQEMLLDGKLSSADYSDIRKRYEMQIGNLEMQISNESENESEFKQCLRKGTQLLKNISDAYSGANTILKQRSIRSMFKEKMIFFR